MGLNDAQSDSADQLRPGDIFGDYQVLRRLSFGLILNYYKVQHKREEHEVTLGIFHRKTLNDPACLDRVKLLQDQIAHCERDEIPKIIKCARINDLDCIILEDVAGESLSSYHASAGGRLGADFVLRVTAQLLDLMAYSDAKDLYHCDLNSDLIFLTDKGGLQVLGLGIKNCIGGELFESIVSASVSPLQSEVDTDRLSSFDVMSPEYKKGLVEDHRADTYAVGALAYWMLCGQKIEHSQYKPVSSLIDDLFDYWDGFLRKSLERDRDRRYPSSKIALQCLLVESEDDGETAVESKSESEVESTPSKSGVSSRFSLKSRALRLLLIGCVALVFAGLGAYYFGGIFMSSSDLPPVRAIEAGSSLLPNVKLKVKPKQAQLSFTDINARFRTDQGQFDLMVLPGEYSFRVRAAGHYDLVQPITISEQQGEVHELDLVLKPKPINFNVLSEPGAQVILINESDERFALGTLNTEGKLAQWVQVNAGTYTLIVQKQGYETQTIQEHQIMVQKDVPFEVVLTPLPAQVEVRTEPAGARVYIDGADLGRSPINVTTLSLGESHEIIVQLDGYRPVAHSLQLQAGEKQIIDFGKLVPQVGGVALAVSFERTDPLQAPKLLQELRVEIAGQQLPYGSGRLAAIPQGLHTVRLLHPSYVPVAREIEVKDGRESALAVRLLPRPAQLAVTLPDGLDARILVDGQLVKPSEGRITLPSNQLLGLEVRIRDYLTMRRSFEFEPNETLSWEVDPIPIPAPEFEKPWVVPYLGMKFVWNPALEFNAGSELKESGRLPNEGPLTNVNFSRGFWAGVYEVTQAQYSQLMNAAPSRFEADNKPVEMVTWADANEFCRILNEQEAQANRLPAGYAYRLPTEFEWESFARGGTDTPFYFGEQADSSNGNFIGVYPRNSGSNLVRNDLYGTTAVGAYSPNALGLYDVHGNVQEWSQTTYEARLPGGKIDGSAPLDLPGDSITVRGGTWQQNAVLARSAARKGLRPELKNSETGFRVVLAPQL